MGVWRSMLVGALLAGAALQAQAACRYVKFATLPITLDGASPLLDGSVNGSKTSVLVDSGSSSTLLTRATAERLKLDLAHVNSVGYGVNGESAQYSTRVDEVSFGPVRWTRANLLVLWDTVKPAPFGIVLGADFLLQQDIEVSFADQQLRFFRPEGCDAAFLAYWNRDAAVVPMLPMAPDDRRQVVTVEINGTPLRALIDTGASFTIVDANAAARVGAKRVDSADGMQLNGIGTRAVEAGVATFDSFAIGGEVIRNANIVVSSLWGATLADSNNMRTAALLRDQPEVILGADFLKAHRVLLAVSQRRFYFSYLGGPVFAGSP